MGWKNLSQPSLADTLAPSHEVLEELDELSALSDVSENVVSTTVIDAVSRL